MPYGEEEKLEDAISDASKLHTEQQKELVKDEYIVNVFPDESKLVAEKLSEMWQEAEELYRKLLEIRKTIDRMQYDTFSRWFTLKAEKFKEGRRLKWLKEQISRLERLKLAYEKKNARATLSQEYFKTIKEKEQYDLDKWFAQEGLLVDLASYYGVSLKQAGTIFRGNCPFHNEKSPSFFIYKDNWYHCFGCQAHGHFIDFVMKKNNVTFREALEDIHRFT